MSENKIIYYKFTNYFILLLLHYLDQDTLSFFQLVKKIYIYHSYVLNLTIE